MSTLRITIPPLRITSRLVAGAGAALLLGLGLFGCGTGTPSQSDPATGAGSPLTPGSNDPAWLTSREQLPPPDPERIEYDADKRTLNLYDLPSRDNWMVRLPNEPAGRLVGPQHRLPEGIDKENTLVFYVRAGSKFSSPVTIAQIEAGRMAHTSLAIGN
jgi:hypothetical protein